MDLKKPDQIQRRSQYGNLEIDLEQSSGDQFMMQSQKLPDMKQYYGLNQLDEDNSKAQASREDKDQSKFANENTMAKSNLRQKNITFNFGSMSDYSNSEEEQENPAANQQANQQQYG